MPLPASNWLFQLWPLLVYQYLDLKSVWYYFDFFSFLVYGEWITFSIHELSHESKKLCNKIYIHTILTKVLLKDNVAIELRTEMSFTIISMMIKYFCWM